MQEAPVLRPLGVGDMIDRTFRLIRANFVLFVSISVIPALAIEILTRAAGLSQTITDFSQLIDPRSPAVAPRSLTPANAAAVLGVVLATIVISIVVYGALNAAVADRYLGRPITIGAAFRRGLRATPVVFVAVVLVFIAIGAVFTAIFFAVAALNVGALSVIAGIVGFFAFCFMLPWSFASIAVLGPAIVIERIGPIAGIRRSLHLIDKARWRSIGLYILVFIITIIITLIFSLLFLVSFVTDPTARTVLQAIASIASSAISAPLIYGAFVLLYYDLRVRKEAFDLQLAAEALPREG